MINALNKKWKEFLYAFSGFGPNFLMVLMGAYFTDAINPSALANSGEFQRFASGACFILPAVFPILYAISKAFDGIIDIPFAHISDTLSTKWGRRRPAILFSLIPMIISYVMCWIPIGGVNNPTLNTIWIILWALVFFSTYTMGMIAFYGSLSTTCINEPQRLRVSGYKSFFDTISYCLVYALVPVILSGAKVYINEFVYICSPLMLTLLIPIFMIKEGEKYGYPENAGLTSEEKPKLLESLRMTFKNKIFMRWQVVNCCTFFGLQMFLVSMNTLIIGGMGMNGLEMALLNTCAFGPVPIMLYLFNKLKAKKGVRFAYQTCLISFAVAILSFFLGNKFDVGENNKILQYVIGIIGGLCGSWVIGAFFMMPYLVPAQVSSVEEKLTGKNHSAMYFAANAVCSSIVSAISGSLVYELIKNLFISKSASGVIWATGTVDELGNVTNAITVAAQQFDVPVNEVFNLGTLLVPFIVAICCALGAVLAARMPKDYTPDLVAKEIKKLDPSVDVSAIEADEQFNAKEEKGEIIFVQIGLCVLSGFIFGFIWLNFLFKSVKEFFADFKRGLFWLLCALVPFASIFVTLKLNAQIKEKATALGVKIIDCNWLFIALGILFPIMPVNVVALALIQKNVNTLYAAEEGLSIAAEAVTA
ncbi:MAG: MFS transporter [Clostridia bacterium]|nr:MFS transporter [Clostridia bacterium]